MALDLLPAPVVTADGIKRLLRARHPRPAWLVWTELNVATGMRGQNYIDVYAMAVYPSEQHRRIAYEIKVSRSDFLREIKDPTKRKEALCWSNRYYFVTPPGLVKPAELPPECGLMEIRERRPRWGGSPGTELAPEIVAHAPWRDTPPPSWGLLASMVRSYKETTDGE